MTGDDTSSMDGAAPGESPNGGPSTSALGSQDGYDVQQIQDLARHPPPGASVYSPSAPVSNILNPRSCVTCRRRKVRCDKHMPCSNCRRAHIPCIFPAPGRAPRRPRPKHPSAPSKQPSSERELELVKRLRKLEGIVEELSGQIELETVRHPMSNSNSPEAVAESHDVDHHDAGGRYGAGDSAVSVNGSNNSQDSPIPSASVALRPARPAARVEHGQNSHPGPQRAISSDVQKQFGRLVLNQKGGTRYVSSGFWSSITDELDEIRRQADNYTDESHESDEDVIPEPTSQDTRALHDHQSFILGYRSADVDLRPLHPLPSQIPFIWQVYQENVDPILKVLHVPTVTKLIRGLRDNMDTLTPATEALMFSIYYASLTSLDEDEVRMNFGADKDDLAKKYRFALEQALAKANFLTTPDLMVCQAFLLFLVIVRRHDDTRFAWTLTGLLIRMSQALGLHRDGSHFSNLTPFEVEMRRRLFWSVLVLDLRSAEDQGTDLTLVDTTFDTKLPLNINDSDISPDSKELPASKDGPTDMTFSLIRYEICSLARRLHTASSASAPVCPRDAASSLEEREALLLEKYDQVHSKYLNFNYDDNPMYWVAKNVTSVILAKMRLVIYQPVLFPGPGNGWLSPETRARLFVSATEIFEYNHLLNTDPRSKQWRWLFQTYTQWQAVAYALIEVSHREWSASVERAWAALNLVFSTPKPLELEKIADHMTVWLPLRKLYLKAKKHRDAEIVRLRANPQDAEELDLEDRRNAPPQSLSALPASMKCSIANDRWRKLINAPPRPPQPIQPPKPKDSEVSPPIRRTDTSGTDQGRPNTGMVETPEFMDYVDAAILDPAFNPQNFANLWNRDAVMHLGGPSMFAFAEGDMSQHMNAAPAESTSLYGASTTMAGPLRTMTAGSSTSFHHQHQHQQPSPAFSRDDLPPWLWSSNTGADDAIRVPNLNHVEMDVNMDEGFDWQNWQESLGRFEMEANGGAASGAWMPGL
ncbi:fungal-specific transcription factor domain-containing protein [Podospora didyma]|uniref:Fungal-specific transcription factor domain-containing protein n=1 Tax=Podospora didyma TaxID=330526 RepID=A0AAE0P3J3_9PEZI|nr:fungal-specific transcription factor domain-containing protein [Podospora didyma]